MRSVINTGQSNLALVTYTVDFTERPVCNECNTPMNVHSYSKLSEKVGLHENYYVRFKYYICENHKCPSCRKNKIRAKNPYNASGHIYDYEVEAKICEIHFKGVKNLGEIKGHFLITYGIDISDRKIGEVIRQYEIASKYENSTVVIEEIKKNGGSLILVDAIHPRKGERMIIAAKDFFSGRTIYDLRVKTQKFEVQRKFHEKLKQIMEENEITVLGIMSDDHKSQRMAIKDVWGDQIPHCSCHFHFFKQIMEKPLELHSRLVKNIRKGLRKITWVENFRKGDLKLDGERQISQYLEKFIKDLFALTKWKTGRNNFRLDAAEYYDRTMFYYEYLLKLKNGTYKHGIILNSQEGRILRGLILRLRNILDENRTNYEEINSILISIRKIEEILNNHGEKEEKGLEALEKILEVLRERQETEKELGKCEKHFIKELVDFVSDRGQTLFNYRRVNAEYIKYNKDLQKKIRNAKTQEEINNIKNKLYVPKTNNDLELMFKLIRYFLKRTLGQHNANRYLLAHGEYILFVDMDASFEKIKQILMTADYKVISEEIKRNMRSKLTRFNIIKDREKFESVKKEYEKMLAEILADYI